MIWIDFRFYHYFWLMFFFLPLSVFCEIARVPSELEATNCDWIWNAAATLIHAGFGAVICDCMCHTAHSISLVDVPLGLCMCVWGVFILNVTWTYEKCVYFVARCDRDHAHTHTQIHRDEISLNWFVSTFD